MSYPGYPTYPQGQGQQQEGPYPQGSPMYPPYPNAGGVYPPSLGYGINAPLHMPQPYAPNYMAQGGGQPYPYPTPNAQPPPQNATPSTTYPNPIYNQSDYHNPTVIPSQSSSIIVQKKMTPTVVPVHPFDPRNDAEILRKAMKGFGTDEKAIINVLTKRTNAQRLEIAVHFKTMYGKDLISDLKSELSGNFENIIVAMMTPLPYFYAQQLHKAISGLGTDEDTLIEVMCTLTNAEIRAIRTAYEANFRHSLEQDLMGDTSGCFRRLMVSLCNAGRDETMQMNPAGAQADAQALLRAGEFRLGTDESTFNMILSQRNFRQMQLIFDEYQRLTNHGIEKAIKGEFSGHIEDALLAVVHSIKNRPEFFAKRLHHSMAGAGTKDDHLIRLVVTRCEVDMGDIKQEYQKKYGKSLAAAIKDDCSGDYKKCLLGLIGEY